jgi:dienelactone hydrolase
VLTLALGAALALAGASPFADLAPGSHPVGFRRLGAASALPPWIDGPRPIEIVLWYPATRATDARPLTLGRYLDLSPDLVRRSLPPGSSADDRAALLSTAMTGASDAIPRDQAESLLAEPMLAREDAPAATGRFPIVLWTARYGTTAAQAPLSEWLASHGYVIAFARATEAQEKLPFELKDPAEKLLELDRQIADLRGALRALRELPHAQTEAATILAWSYAGETASRVAFGDPGVRNVIGLSTNTLADWVYQPEKAPERLAAPLLLARHWIVREEYGRDGSPRVKPAIWDRLAPGSAFVRVPGMAHGSFNALEGYLPSVLGLTRAQPWSRVGPEARVGYVAVARLILAVLRGDEALPKGLRVERRTGAPIAPIAARPTTLQADDGVTVTSDVYTPVSARVGCVLLMHQSGGSRGEYRVIGPQLAAHGWLALAADLRFGRQDRSTGIPNETGQRVGTPAILDRNDAEARRALVRASRADVEASLAHLTAAGCRDVVLWGSSATTIQALQRAKDDPRIRAAILFSPGEYLRDDPEAMRTIARQLRRPILVVHGREEAELALPVAEAIPAALRTVHASDLGAHGSAILVEDGGAWKPVRDFLDGLRALAAARAAQERDDDEHHDRQDEAHDVFRDRRR